MLLAAHVEGAPSAVKTVAGASPVGDASSPGEPEEEGEEPPPEVLPLLLLDPDEPRPPPPRPPLDPEELGDPFPGSEVVGDDVQFARIGAIAQAAIAMASR